MSQSYTFNPDHSRTFDRPVSHVGVTTGSLLVSETDDPVLIKEGEDRDFPDVANLTFYSPNGARCFVTYYDEAFAQRASRGDSGGGDSGGFESRTVDQLRAEAGKRKIAGRSKMDKAALIAALRGEG